MDDTQFGFVGVVVDVAWYNREVDRLEITYPPDRVYAPVDFLLRPGHGDRSHFVVHDLVEGWLGLEAIEKTVVFQEPGATIESLQCTLDDCGVVALCFGGRQGCQHQLGRLDAAGDTLGQAMQEDGGSQTRRIGRLATGNQRLVRFHGMGRNTSLGTHNVRLTHLFELWAVEPAGQIF